MAAREGTYFDKEQMEVLASSVKCLANNIDQQWEEVNKVFQEIWADGVIADGSAYKEPVSEACKITEDAYKSVQEKLAMIHARIDGIAEQYHIAIQANLKKSQDAVAAITKQAAKAKEATGAGA